MSGIQVTALLQIMCLLVVAGQIGENVTLPSIELSTPATTNKSRGFPSGFIKFPELGLAYKLSEDYSTHNRAIDACMRENARLAVIDSEDKINKIVNRFGDIGSRAAGLLRVDDTEEWETVYGKSTNNLPWETVGHTEGRNCASVFSRTRSLYRADCDGYTMYMCEITWPRN